jgi:hypothetical protein
MMDDSSLSLQQQVLQSQATREAISTELDFGYKAARMFNAQNKAYGGGGSSQGGGGGGGAKPTASSNGGFNPFE